MGKSLSKLPISRNCVRFALVGSTGCGKSAFVNAVRGIDDEDEDAAEVSLVAKRQQLKEYAFPSHPRVRFYELPGYNTPRYPDGETFWGKLELETFDAFLIFVSCRVTKTDLEIIEKVKSIKKPFFLIRTRIDVDYDRKEGKIRINEEAMLSKIKNYLVEKMGRQLTGGDIFLISNYDPYKWDFFRLIEAIINIMPNPETDPTSVTEQYMAHVRTHVQQNNVFDVEELLEETKDLKIRFAIAGDSEAEKLALINAFRGLEDDDDDAAKIEDTTTARTKYTHPEKPNITFVNLPCVGSPKYSDFQTFCDEVRIDNYDVFLILTLNRFTQYDIALAKKVKSIGKSFHLVRTKIDDACTLHEERPSTNEAEILEKIKENCVHDMKDVLKSEEEIFLISSYHKDRWDFDRLIEAISKALPVHQRECLTLSLSNMTRSFLVRKAEFLKAQAFAVAAAISVEPLPIPAVKNEIDVTRIGGAIAAYYRYLQLHHITPEDLELLNKEIRGIVERYDPETAAEFALPTGTKRVGVEEVSKFIPIIGTAIAGSESFAVTLSHLTHALNEMEKAALAVWDDAVRKSMEKSFESTTIVNCKTKFTNSEISQLSNEVGLHWDELAGLMDISYSKREEIRLNPKYSDFSLKAEQIFVHFNLCDHSCRHHLKKCVEELEQHDLESKILPVENENPTEEVETPLCQPEVYEKENVENKTPLSPREMFRLSRRITVDWDNLGGSMDIAKEQRNDIGSNTMYEDHRARAEKILSIFNLKKSFSREKLAKCLEEIGKSDLIQSVTTGEYRKL